MTKCAGDGNLDLLVDGNDLAGWQGFSKKGGKSSWYDLNYDGLTDARDWDIILKNFWRRCK